MWYLKDQICSKFLDNVFILFHNNAAFKSNFKHHTIKNSRTNEAFLKIKYLLWDSLLEFDGVLIVLLSRGEPLSTKDCYL